MPAFTAVSVFVRANENSLGRALNQAVKPRLGSAARSLTRTAKDLIVAAAPVGWRPPYYGEGRLSDRDHYVTSINEIPQGFRIDFRAEGNARWLAKFHSVNKGSRTHPIDSANWMPMIYEGETFDGWYKKHVKEGHGHPGNHFYDDAIAVTLGNAGYFLR